MTAVISAVFLQVFFCSGEVHHLMPYSIVNLRRLAVSGGGGGGGGGVPVKLQVVDYYYEEKPKQGQ